MSKFRFKVPAFPCPRARGATRRATFRNRKVQPSLATRARGATAHVTRAAAYTLPDRAQGMTLEKVAKAVGVNEITVRRASHSTNVESEITNERGQSRPAHYAPREDKPHVRQVVPRASEHRGA